MKLKVRPKFFLSLYFSMEDNSGGNCRTLCPSWNWVNNNIELLIVKVHPSEIFFWEQFKIVGREGVLKSAVAPFIGPIVTLSLNPFHCALSVMNILWPGRTASCWWYTRFDKPQTWFFQILLVSNCGNTVLISVVSGTANGFTLGDLPLVLLCSCVF